MLAFAAALWPVSAHADTCVDRFRNSGSLSKEALSDPDCGIATGVGAAVEAGGAAITAVLIVQGALAASRLVGSGAGGFGGAGGGAAGAVAGGPQEVAFRGRRAYDAMRLLGLIDGAGQPTVPAGSEPAHVAGAYDAVNGHVYERVHSVGYSVDASGRVIPDSAQISASVSSPAAADAAHPAARDVSEAARSAGGAASEPAHPAGGAPSGPADRGAPIAGREARVGPVDAPAGATGARAESGLPAGADSGPSAPPGSGAPAAPTDHPAGAVGAGGPPHAAQESAFSRPAGFPAADSLPDHAARAAQEAANAPNFGRELADHAARAQQLPAHGGFGGAPPAAPGPTPAGPPSVYPIPPAPQLAPLTVHLQLFPGPQGTLLGVYATGGEIGRQPGYRLDRVLLDGRPLVTAVFPRVIFPVPPGTPYRPNQIPLPALAAGRHTLHALVRDGAGAAAEATIPYDQ